MARVRQLYQSDLLYVGPTGGEAWGGQTIPATGRLSSAGIYGNILAGISGTNYIAQLHRVQRVDDSWNRTLTNVNQIGQLAAIDRVTLTQPTVSLTASWIQNNMVNEKLIGLTVASAAANSPSLVSCISGILAQTTEPLNYFLKTSAEGADAINDSASSYDVISFGNCYLDSYTANGRIGEFPTVDVSFRSLNAQAQSVDNTAGAQTPAVTLGNAQAINWGYILPTGNASYQSTTGINTSNATQSALRPGDITLSLGIGVGDGFALGSDLKLQSYSLSIPFNREDMLQLGSKYAFAILPRFPLDVSLSVEALIGANQTGALTEIVNNNKAFNPTIAITKPGDTSTTMVYYKLGGAKLQEQTFSQSVGSTAKTVRMTFQTQIGGPQDVVNGVYMSGIVG